MFKDLSVTFPCLSLPDPLPGPHNISLTANFYYIFSTQISWILKCIKNSGSRQQQRTMANSRWMSGKDRSKRRSCRTPSTRNQTKSTKLPSPPETKTKLQYGGWRTANSTGPCSSDRSIKSTSISQFPMFWENIRWR